MNRLTAGSTKGNGSIQIEQSLQAREEYGVAIDDAVADVYRPNCDTRRRPGNSDLRALIAVAVRPICARLTHHQTISRLPKHHGRSAHRYEQQRGAASPTNGQRILTVDLRPDAAEVVVIGLVAGRVGQEGPRRECVLHRKQRPAQGRGSGG